MNVFKIVIVIVIFRGQVCPEGKRGHDGNDAGNASLIQDLRIGDLFLPADTEKVSKASEIDVISLFFMSSLCDPGFRAVV